MAFSTLKPKVKGSLPEGAECGVSYSLKDNDHFDPNDVDELKHWEDEEYITSDKEKEFQALKMRVSQSQAELQENDRMNIIGQNGKDGLHYDTGSIKTTEKDIYNEKEKKDPPAKSRSGGYWF